MSPKPREWKLSFLDISASHDKPIALIILNQPFSRPLLERLWRSASWRACADGGANRLYDVLALHQATPDATQFLPDVIKGDLDSLRNEVRAHYTAIGVPVVQDKDEYTTDLMKCVESLEELESPNSITHDIVLLGGLSGRLDQTIHTLSYLHKLRHTGRRVFAVTDDNIGWVLDVGEHIIKIDHNTLGPTCGLLPVGVESAVISTRGLVWDLDESVSSFDGLMSTSNHLIPGQDVWVRTSRPIFWSVELRSFPDALC
ncbi:thiamine pyrophosphokinase Thi80 [Vararia minispora EC-137]|uniref:Thiamine pyrophosphokinase Thi80 n=1 Tax=Vararia minispora EC-137 TaxID=1314806 RepID=A0ACB8QPJ9_9AGAM|nr:thiamine pyrophosphokinase Thi80 [Vararia minispora EC-137]